ncbi:MAG: VWA domain-containing protein [Polyangiales bacterium]|nr:VWA domain-containing protein [Myxococcales bacterium]MCB9657068.1 VWA domain-containing protein [Sandaracinaceae bacterium]
MSRLPHSRARRLPLRLALVLSLSGCGASGSSYESAPETGGAHSPASVEYASTSDGAWGASDGAAAPTGAGGESEGHGAPGRAGGRGDSLSNGWADGTGGLPADVPSAAPSPVPSRTRGAESSRPATEAEARMAPPPPHGGGAADIDVSVTVTLEETVVAPEPPPVVQQQVAPQARVLTAATVGDSDRRGNYLEYVGRRPFEAQRAGFDVSRRVRFRVVDAQGRPFRGAEVTLGGQRGRVGGTTMADGYWDYFPGVLGDVGSDVQATVSANGVQAQVAARIPAAGDGQDVVFRMQGVSARAPQRLDLAFLIDVTGSMEDELRYVNSEVADIVGRIHASSPEVAIRVGATFYRDRTDREPLQEIRFTSDIQGFARTMLGIRADGGGDYPEDMNAGLAAAFGRQTWSEGDAVRVLVVIADAPPQSYQTSFTYVQAMREASRRGIRLLPVAASGADREVEFLFRAMATVTGAPYTYLTDESGVGNPHMEADTDRVAIEYWNDQLTRLVTSDLRGLGMHELIPN